MLARSARRLLVASAAAATVLTALCSAPAQADSESRDDQTGDVANLDRTRLGEPFDVNALDIASYKHAYARNKLTLTTTIVGNIRYEDVSFVWDVKAGGETYTGFTYRDGGSLLTGFRDENDKFCRAADAAIRGDHTVILTVPRKCIDNARSVRVTNWTSVVLSDDEMLVDDGNQGMLENGYQIKYGKRLSYN